MKEIKNLPGFYWVYANKPNIFGLQVKTRTAYNPTSGETLNVRQVQTRTHEGISYEERVPKQERKKYVRRVGKNILRHGPFNPAFSDFDPTKFKMNSLYTTMGHGELNKSNVKSGGSGPGYRIMLPLTNYKNFLSMTHRIQQHRMDIKGYNLLDGAFKKNLNAFISVEEYYVLEYEKTV